MAGSTESSYFVRLRRFHVLASSGPRRDAGSPKFCQISLTCNRYRRTAMRGTQLDLLLAELRATANRFAPNLAELSG